MDPETNGGNQTESPQAGLTAERAIELISKATAEAVSKALDGFLDGQKRTAPSENTIGAMILTPPRSKAPLSNDPSMKGIGAARFVRALAASKGDPEKAIHFAKQFWNDDLGDSVQKALAAGTLTAGGALVPPEFSMEVIELLRSRSVVRAAGARIVPMMTGSITLPKQTAGSQAVYEGENQGGGAVTQPATGQLVMTAKKLKAIVPISNDLLQYAPGNSADIFVRDDLVACIATREDQAFLRDNGIENKPKGLRYWANAANISAITGADLDDIRLDFNTLVNGLETNNVRMLNPVWLMSPRTKNYLMFQAVDLEGRTVFAQELMGGRLFSWPVFVSTNIPTNLNGTQSEIYFVDMADAIIAESGDLEIMVDSSASYTDNGTLVSAFERDQTLMRAITKHDFAVRHDLSVAIKTGVTY